MAIATLDGYNFYFSQFYADSQVEFDFFPAQL